MDCSLIHFLECTCVHTSCAFALSIMLHYDVIFGLGAKNVVCPPSLRPVCFFRGCGMDDVLLIIFSHHAVFFSLHWFLSQPPYPPGPSHLILVQSPFLSIFCSCFVFVSFFVSFSFRFSFRFKTSSPDGPRQPELGGHGPRYEVNDI